MRNVFFLLMVSMIFLMHKCSNKTKEDRRIPLKTLPKIEDKLVKDSTINLKK